jgi:hypothetical protein
MSSGQTDRHGLRFIRFIHKVAANNGIFYIQQGGSSALTHIKLTFLLLSTNLTDVPDTLTGSGSLSADMLVMNLLSKSACTLETTKHAREFHAEVKENI